MKVPGRLSNRSALSGTVLLSVRHENKNKLESGNELVALRTEAVDFQIASLPER